MKADLYLLLYNALAIIFKPHGPADICTIIIAAIIILGPHIILIDYMCFPSKIIL